MRIAVPKEIKKNEARVGLVPTSVADLVKRGHQLVIETTAGDGIGASDADYIAAGAEIAGNADDTFNNADMIVKVKEPQPIEWARLNEKQILFTYLHLAADMPQTKGLLESGCTAIAYETITDAQGGLPLLAPMSEIAGRLAVIEGASHLKIHNGGRGMLISGVPGTSPSKVVIIGAGSVGGNAAQMAVGLGADVMVFDKSLPRLRQMDAIFGNRIVTAYSSDTGLYQACLEADLVIGAVLIPGASAPKLVAKSWLQQMKKRALLVDVAIDQGGCFETSRATTHEDPTYVVDDVLHYCVANMPGAVPLTSSQALNNATLPYVMKLADKGVMALNDDAGFMKGLNVRAGKIMHPAVQEFFDKNQ